MSTLSTTQNVQSLFRTSAGSVICGLHAKIQMTCLLIPPPSFQTLAVTPFNINAHYLDPWLINLKHMGETRENQIERISFFNNMSLGLSRR
jgi:dipeptidase E